MGQNQPRAADQVRGSQCWKQLTNNLNWHIILNVKDGKCVGFDMGGGCCLSGAPLYAYASESSARKLYNGVLHTRHTRMESQNATWGNAAKDADADAKAKDSPLKLKTTSAWANKVVKVRASSTSCFRSLHIAILS